MKIEIDRNKRIVLLRWLKQGYIDSDEIYLIEPDEPLSEEEARREWWRLRKHFVDSNTGEAYPPDPNWLPDPYSNTGKSFAHND